MKTTSTTKAALLASVTLLVGCSVTTPEPATPATDIVRVVTHDSFSMSEELVTQFEDISGYTLEFSAPGDGGALVNQLILTQDSPLGDAAYGVDNTFASRAVAAGVFTPYESPMVTVEGQQYQFDDSDVLTAVDVGDVCFNVDRQWFAEAGIPEPSSLTDLTHPQYADLTVVPNPATSSPGLAMLVATVGQFGVDGFADFWAQMRANGVKVVAGWSDAYYVDFSGSQGAGDRPIVLSYSTSAAYEEPGRTTALLDTCFRQVEYVGVLTGAENVAGAQAFVDFMLSEQVQSSLPEAMFVYPVIPGAQLPAEWVESAPLAPSPIEVTPAQIEAGRDDWIATWTQVVID
ncbi:MAG: thiamine ABC transporter substrate binding subunit [Beutenbergiaceae bacterium]